MDSSTGRDLPIQKPSSQLNSVQKKKKKKKQRKKGTRIFLSTLICLGMTVFLTGCIIGGYVLTNIIIYTNRDPVIDLAELKANQNQTSIMYADNGGKTVEIARLHGEENRIWVDYSQMPDYLIKAFVALEDKRFWDHDGVDWYRLVGVMTKYRFDQGASTITQQLIKNVTNKKDVTFVRKYNEIMSALNLEKNYSKEKILEAYLNTLYLGSGCYGVQTAAETYFGKDVSELNLSECAVIAAITKAPYSYNPLYNPESNRERQLDCLTAMLAQEKISQAEYDEAKAYSLLFTNDPQYVSDEKEEDEEEEDEFQSYYVDYVIDSVIDDLREKYGYTKQEATDKIYYGGLKIYSAVDLKIQKIMEDVYVNRVTMPDEEDTFDDPAAQSAMTVMDYEGRIVGIVGGAGEKTNNRSLNRAADSPRQPGSTIKPLATYAPAIEADLINWSSQILNYAFPLPGTGNMWPRNVDTTYGSNTYVTVQYAIQVSLNTVPARIINTMLGVSSSMDWLINKFHFTTVDEQKDAALSPMAVGGMTYGMTTLEMAAAYASFGNGGYYYEPYCYYKVTNSTGTEVLLEPSHYSEQVLSADTADVMNELLQTVNTSDYGKGSYVRKSEIMAKTGTTDDNKNRWMAGGTPYYVASTWFGYDLPESITVSGNPASRIFIEVFDRIHEELDLEGKEFNKSGGTVQKKYCTSSGLLAGANCSSTSVGWYKSSHLPEVCTSCQTNPISDIASSILDRWFNRSRGTEETTAAPAEPDTQPTE